jgi:hypothetical protein
MMVCHNKTMGIVPPFAEYAQHAYNHTILDADLLFQNTTMGVGYLTPKIPCIFVFLPPRHRAHSHDVGHGTI